MAKKQTLSVTLPDGSKDTRTTAHEYRFVACFLSDGTGFSPETSEPGWVASSWSATRAGAESRIPGMLRCAGIVKAVVLPVDGTEAPVVTTFGDPWIAPPGTGLGPCADAECPHQCCAESRRMAETPCAICGQATGFNQQYRFSSLGHTHTVCWKKAARAR